MIRTQVYLDPAHHGELKREARRAKISMTELVRRIVADHVEGRRGVGAFRKEEVLAFVGLGESGEAGTSENHDAALDEALGGKDIR